MSAPGRPKRELLPLGGKARSAKGAPISAAGRPKRELLPLGGKARSAKGAPISAAGEAKAGTARRRAIARARQVKVRPSTAGVEGAA
jgi:hypothetical protein